MLLCTATAFLSPVWWAWSTSRQSRFTDAVREDAIFFAASRNNEHSQRYRQFIASRDDYVYLKDHEYPEDLQQAAAERQVVFG